MWRDPRDRSRQDDVEIVPAETRDLDRFREFLRDGAPGPHAYVVLLGMDTFDPISLYRVVDRGLPFRTFERFRRNIAFSLEQATALVGIPRRTLTRRKADGRLTREESDRLLRAARIFAAALALFNGARTAASEWLTTPNVALGGAIPLDVARNEVGAQEIQRVLHRLEHGVFS